MAAVSHNKEESSESSEDMNKGAGEMDEGSGVRQERDRDGWSEESGCTGAPLRRETLHRCTEEIWERLCKKDKSRSWGRRDNEQRRRGRNMFVWEGRDTGREGDVERKKESLLERIWSGKEEMCPERSKERAKMRRFKKCL